MLVRKKRKKLIMMMFDVVIFKKVHVRRKAKIRRQR